MGRYDEAYSEAQRTAVGSYMLDPDPLTGKRHTAPEAIEALMAGRLGVPPPPEPMPKSTAYYCRDREQARRQGTSLSPLARTALQDPETVREQMIQRAVSIWDYDCQRLEAQQAKGKTDPRLFSMVMKNTPLVLGLLRKPSNQPKGKPPVDPKGQDRQDDNTQPDELTQLVAAHENTSRGTHASTHGVESNGHATDSGARWPSRTPVPARP